jgi:hypothetical protein
MAEKQRGFIVGGLFIALLLGIGLGYTGRHLFEDRVSTDWRPVVVSGHHFGEEFATEAIFTDVPVPDIKKFGGQVKFIDNIYRPPQDPEFGYDLTVVMTDAPANKIPDHYKHPKPVVINGLHLTESAPDHFYYSIEFHFTLRDKDGFDLMELKSKPEDLIAGTTNTYKAKLDQRVPFNIAIRTASIEAAPYILKCTTCTGSDTGN